MIVIKTDMKEMPKGCGECNNLRFQQANKRNGYFCCGEDNLITKRHISQLNRPEWCPLIEAKDEIKVSPLVVANWDKMNEKQKEFIKTAAEVSDE